MSERSRENLPAVLDELATGYQEARAAAAFRWRLRGSGATVVTISPPRGGGLRDWLRELPCWTILPFQLATNRPDESRPVGEASEDQ